MIPMSDKPHFLAKRFQDFQRQSTRTLTCSLCPDEPSFFSEAKLWDHAKLCHPSVVGDGETVRGGVRDGNKWKVFMQDATNKAKLRTRVKVTPTPSSGISKPSPNDIDSMRLDVGGEDVNVKSRSPSRPKSSPGPPEKRIADIENLSLSQTPDLTVGNHPGYRPPPSPVNRRKRAANVGSEQPELYDEPEDGHGQPRSRRAKALSGGPYPFKDSNLGRNPSSSREPEFIRDRAAPNKRLFDPNIDQPSQGSIPRRSGTQDTVPGPRRVYDSRVHVFRSKKESSEERRPESEIRMLARQQQPMEIRNPDLQSSKPNLEQPLPQESTSPPTTGEVNGHSEPEMLLQPETRPISHEQLVVEVKGIYAGIVMVETKCKDVDEKQTAAAQEKDPSRQTKLTNEQWQALIALHKTLLHEHHDFFLASQHPSASSALSRLAAKYSMPARMWRHGIHAFLEVLRHRLPESLDHMLAFIYIAYSMMALLYETVTAFKDTWIECLGDLGRYRMAIEDDDIKDREVWSGVARHWYGKAADSSPNIGRLYHHLAILARPYTLQQLSFYTRSLTCIHPFESARGSIMTLFNPILEGKESAYHRPSSMETLFIKAHGILFTGRPLQEFDRIVQQLLEGLFDDYIGRIAAKFKENGVFAALSNISSLYEYGVLRPNGSPRSIFRLLFEEVRNIKQQAAEKTSDKSLNIDDADSASPPSQPAALIFASLTQQELKSSTTTVSHAAILTFGTLSIALRRIGDKNVLPMVHVYFVFLWSLTCVDKAMKHVEKDVPWADIVSFLNTLAKPETMSAKVELTDFPKPEEGIGRPLPEDFVMRGQPWSENLFPEKWFEDAMIDDEERSLELPSMAAPRIERIVWLGHRIASSDKWIRYDAESCVFVTTKYADGLSTRAIERSIHAEVVDQTDGDSIMSDSNDYSKDLSLNNPNTPPKLDAPSIESDVPELQPLEPIHDNMKSRNSVNAHLGNKADAKLVNISGTEYESASPPLKPLHPDSADWLKYSTVPYERSPQKDDLDRYRSDPRKLDCINALDPPDHKDPTET